jgi:hypothetical protein
VAEADPAFQIADYDEGGETEAFTSLHDLGDAINVNKLLRELAITLIATAAAAAVSSLGTCHCQFLSI